MRISIVNFTRTQSDVDVGRVVRAINRQIRDDFEPCWSVGASLRLEGAEGPAELQKPQDLRGDGVIYLWDGAGDVRGALGYHAENNFGLPFGFVFTEVSQQLGEHWSVTLSHEALELIGDANVNRLAAGPHPADPGKVVFHWYEMCDAVQSESYEIDGVRVSNFVLPLYFTIGEQLGARNDFLTLRHGGRALRSFGVNPGGYVGFVNPETGRDETFTMHGDQLALERLSVKSRIDPRLRRANRYAHLKRRVSSRTADGWLQQDC